MNGRVVEWTPGTDHAGIGTQVIFWLEMNLLNMCVN